MLILELDSAIRGLTDSAISSCWQRQTAGEPMPHRHRSRIVSRMHDKPIYSPPDPGLEAHSRLFSLLSVCEHERASLEALDDVRLTEIIEHMRSFREDLVFALATVADELASDPAEDERASRAVHEHSP